MDFFTRQKERLERYIYYSYFGIEEDERFVSELELIPHGDFESMYALRNRVYWARAVHLRKKSRMATTLHPTRRITNWDFLNRGVFPPHADYHEGD